MLPENRLPESGEGWSSSGPPQRLRTMRVSRGTKQERYPATFMHAFIHQRSNIIAPQGRFRAVARVYRRSNIIAQRWRFRITARGYHGSEIITPRR